MNEFAGPGSCWVTSTSYIRALFKPLPSENSARVLFPIFFSVILLSSVLVIELGTILQEYFSKYISDIFFM